MRHYCLVSLFDDQGEGQTNSGFRLWVNSDIYDSGEDIFIRNLEDYCNIIYNQYRKLEEAKTVDCSGFDRRDYIEDNLIRGMEYDLKGVNFDAVGINKDIDPSQPFKLDRIIDIRVTGRNTLSFEIFRSIHLCH